MARPGGPVIDATIADERLEKLDGFRILDPGQILDLRHMRHLLSALLLLASRSPTS
jgi:hypothetical protein